MATSMFVIGIVFIFIGLLMGGAWPDSPPICGVLYAIAFVFFGLAVWILDDGTTTSTGPIFCIAWLLTGVLVLHSLFEHLGRRIDRRRR